MQAQRVKRRCSLSKTFRYPLLFWRRFAGYLRATKRNLKSSCTFLTRLKQALKTRSRIKWKELWASWRLSLNQWFSKITALLTFKVLILIVLRHLEEVRMRHQESQSEEKVWLLKLEMLMRTIALVASRWLLLITSILVDLSQSYRSRSTKKAQRKILDHRRTQVLLREKRSLFLLEMLRKM